MKILILGGTGAIGRELVDIMSKKNADIYVTTRKNLKSSSNIKYIRGNAHNIKLLEKIIKEYSFDSIIDFMVYDYKEFKNKIEFFLNNTKQYVFLSSARVYSDKDEFINEKTERLLDVCDDKQYLKTHEYALEKAREENLLLNNKKKNWTIIRPYITYNSNRLLLGSYGKEQWLYGLLKGREVVIQKKLLNKKTTLTYGKDVAKYISYLILNEKSYGEIFQIANNNSNTTWQDIIDIYKTELKKKNINMKVKIIEDEKFDKFWPSYYVLKYDRYNNRVFNSNKLEQVLNKEILYTPIEDGIKECLSNFFDNVDKNKIELESTYTALADRITKSHTKLKEFSLMKEKIKYILARYTHFYKLKRYIL